MPGSEDPTVVLPGRAEPAPAPPARRQRVTLTLGVSSLAVTFLAGVWLFLAPFLVDYQNGAQAWTTATENHVITGMVMVAISGLSLLTFATLAVRAALRSRTAEVAAEWHQPAG